MKKLFPFILTGTILASSCMICYGGTATLSKENKETSFDIYATYEPGENDYFSAPVKKDGTCEIELPNGIRISVQDVTQENLTLIVYLIPVQDEDAWEWFTACLSGRGTRLLPFEIYFEDGNGTRIPADKILVQITLPEAYETIAVFALDDMPDTEETPEITLPDSFTHPAGRLLTGHRRNGRRTDTAKHRKNLHLPNRRQPILYPGRKRHSRHTNPIPNPDANRGANQHPNADPNQRADQGTNQYSNGDADQNANENSKPDPITNESPIPLTNPVSDQNPRQPDRKRQPIHRRPDLPGKMDLRCNRIRHWNRGGIQEKERR